MANIDLRKELKACTKQKGIHVHVIANIMLNTFTT